MHFIYAHNGINWLQGEMGLLGLPDIRAQAGVVAEDGRHFYIDGSGTDIVVRCCAQLSESIFYYTCVFSIGAYYFQRKLKY